jgi:hypothetical protein
MLMLPIRERTPFSRPPRWQAVEFGRSGQTTIPQSAFGQSSYANTGLGPSRYCLGE